MSAEKVVGTVVGVGTVYIFTTAFADLLVLALIGAVVAIIFAIMTIVMAVGCWISCLGLARSTGNTLWTRDLLLAPSLGLLIAALLCVPMRTFGYEVVQPWLDRNVNSSNPSGLAELAVLLFGILFFVVLGLTPFTIIQENSPGIRLFAYPLFAFYSTYVLFWAISIGHHA